MGDKPKDKSKEAVAAVLVACGNTSDSSSRSISAGIIADNLAGGAKGAAAITSATRGIDANVGSCVANYYEDKKPGFLERVGSQIGSLTDSFKSVAATTKEDMKVAAHEAVMGGVSLVTAGTPEKIAGRSAQINLAANGP